jgi:hypothetical protein
MQVSEPVRVDAVCSVRCGCYICCCCTPRARPEGSGYLQVNHQPALRVSHLRKRTEVYGSSSASGTLTNVKRRFCMRLRRFLCLILLAATRNGRA